MAEILSIRRKKLSNESRKTLSNESRKTLSNESRKTLSNESRKTRMNQSTITFLMLIPLLERKHDEVTFVTSCC